MPTNPQNTGAVALTLPRCVQAEARERPDCFPDKRVHPIERRAPVEAAVERAVIIPW